MRIFALELNNDIKGILQRQRYIDELIGRLPSPELVVLPELVLCSYMASQKIWDYADDCGQETAEWAIQTAKKTKHISVSAISIKKTAMALHYCLYSENDLDKLQQILFYREVVFSLFLSLYMKISSF